MELEQLRSSLEKAWSAQTGADPEHWSADNSAWGQCAVTALLVQNHLGADIVWTEAVSPEGMRFSHYFNFLNETRDYIDITRYQFPPGTLLSAPSARTEGYPTTRDYLLSNLGTVRRYKLLQRVLAESACYSS